MMKKIFAITAAAMIVLLAVAAPASAQDPVIGTVEASPATVDAAGEHELTASGSGYIPDTTILLGSCKAPGDTLVPGVSTPDEIAAAAQSIDPLVNCDVGTAVSIDVDSDGNFTETVTVTVGDNFFFSAGAIDGSQIGAVWIPIVDPAAQLAVTGVSSWVYAFAGLTAIMIGFAAVATGRRMASAT